jgi:small subunit ribosomal protein S11
MAEEKQQDGAVAAPAVEAEVSAEVKTAPVARSHSRGGRQVSHGIVHILATFNNTMVSITDPRGNVIAWSTSGRCGFKGSRKSTAYAATIVAQEAARAASSQGLREVEVRVQGPGAGRESAIRAIQSAGITVSAISDVTPIPHNGCRPKKRRRV